MISFYRILATTRLTVEPGDFREIGERHDDCHSQTSQNPKFGQIWLTSTKSGGTPLSSKGRVSTRRRRVLKLTLWG